MTDSFADYPESIGERRSDQEGNGALWSPRDALVAVLREIDSGRLKLDAIVVSGCVVHERGKTDTLFWSSAPNVYAALGLLAAASAKISGS